MVTVRVVPGDGLIVRDGAKVIFVPEEAQHDVDLDALRRDLGHLEGTAFTGAVASAVPGARVGVVATGEQGWAVLIPAGMRIRTVYLERESIYDGPLHVVKTDPLQLWLWPAEGEAPPPAAELVVLDGAEGRGDGVVVGVASEAIAMDEDGTVVSGVECVCGVLLRPTTLRCWVCDELVPATARSAEGVRPTLGELIVDAGRAHPLVSDYVVGRDPAATAEVRGRRRALELPDHSHTVSRAHVLVSLDGWDVWLRDMSTNGTFVRPPDGWRWHRLAPGEASRVLPGSDIRLGRRMVRFAPPDTNRRPHAPTQAWSPGRVTG